MTFDEWYYQASPLTPFAFRILEGNVAYVALNSFMDPAVTERFREQIRAIRGCAGLILDLRKNHGGSDSVCYGIASHLLQRPAETVLVRTPRHIASYRAVGVNLKDTTAEGIGALSEGDRERLLCYRRQLMHEEDWGSVQPAQERLAVPTVVLTSPETVSAAEDFLMALESGGAGATRIGGPTAGSTGQPLIEELPAGGMLAICTIRMPWPEAVWRNGIEPHIQVEPTVEDVIEDRDRVLETALQILTGGDTATRV